MARSRRSSSSTRRQEGSLRAFFHAIQNAAILPEQAAPIDYAQAEEDGLAAVQAAKRATRSALRRISRRVGR